MSGSAPSSVALGRTFYRFLVSKSLASVCNELFLVYFLWVFVATLRSVFLAGVIPTLGLLVFIASAVPIGHLIDRANNTVLSLISSLTMLAGFLLLFEGTSTYVVYAVTVVVSLGFTMKGDSFQAIIKKHVSQAGISKATSLNQVSAGLSSLIGIAAGTVALLFLGPWLAYILLGLSVAATVLAFPAPEPRNMIPTGEAGEYGRVLSTLKKLSGFLLLALIINGMFVSLSVYGSGLFNLVLHSTPFFYGVFALAFPAGMLLGASISNKVIGSIDRPRIIAAMIFLYAPMLVVLGASRSPVLDIADVAVLGFLNPLINVPLIARLTKATPKEIFGRTMALLRIFIGSAQPAMAAIFSVIAIYFRVDSVLMAAGLVLVPIALFSLSVLKGFYALEPSKD